MLEKKLEALAASDQYPFHMPGHKRMLMEGGNPYKIDITEIDGFDNLHHPQGILKEEQERAAQLYGSWKTYFLINGSSCGLLAAIGACLPRGGRILVARNCHKAVFHGIEQRELEADYLYPPLTGAGLLGAIDPAEVDRALAEAEGRYQAVLITSPTYDGVVSDVESIAKLVHSYHLPLIVDEAHGAHFPFAENFPTSAIELGADLVIQSSHKTLPALTQTALLHLCSDRVRPERLEHFLDIYETSSPSYVLMSSITSCLELLRHQGERMYGEYSRRLEEFYQKTASLKYLKLVQKRDFKPEEAYDFDSSKILIDTRSAGVTGEWVSQALRNRFAIELEMAQTNYALALSSVMDTEEGFDRLAEALRQLDLECEQRAKALPKRDDDNILKALYQPRRVVETIGEAMEKEGILLPLEEAEGREALEYIYIYPPGIPIVTPGECLDGESLRGIQESLETGLSVLGLREGQKILVSP